MLSFIKRVTLEAYWFPLQFQCRSHWGERLESTRLVHHQIGSVVDQFRDPKFELFHHTSLKKKARKSVDLNLNLFDLICFAPEAPIKGMQSNFSCSLPGTPCATVFPIIATDVMVLVCLRSNSIPLVATGIICEVVYWLQKTKHKQTT